MLKGDGCLKMMGAQRPENTVLHTAKSNTYHVHYPSPIGPLEAPTQQAPVTAEVEKEFLGNGAWPFSTSSAPSQPPEIPPPPEEGVDHAPKTVYKMSSRPRGIGEHN